MTNQPNTPSADLDGRIEAELATMSRWDSAAPGLWERALNEHIGLARSRPSIFTRKVGGPLLLLLLIPLILVPLLLPALGKARSRPVAVSASPSRSVDEVHAMARHVSDSVSADAFATELRHSAVAPTSLGAERSDAGPEDAAPSRVAEAAARLIVRKASIDLAVNDVRAAFAKAAFLVSEAGGEFVENSALTGEGENAQANLTMRVRSDRLGTVLGQLRDLGIVVQESTSGEDVTDQAVDLDARIRNEQRVEKELAELLVTRKDCPLRDIMEVRDALGTVRENIERLIAQRDRLSRLVSLSTILVVIRNESAVRLPDSANTKGLGAYFAKAISDAWSTATRALADTAAFLVTVLIGGAIWWIVAIIGVVAAVRWRARALRARASEPAPAWADAGAYASAPATRNS